MKFYEKFHKYLNREYIVINENNYEEFKKFTKKHPDIVAKSIDFSKQNIVGKVHINNRNKESTYKELLNNKLNIIEEVIKEYPD